MGEREEVVEGKEEETTTSEKTGEETSTSTEVKEEVKEPVEDPTHDEGGVSYYNRFRESERKREKLESEQTQYIPPIVEERVPEGREEERKERLRAQFDSTSENFNPHEAVRQMMYEEEGKRDALRRGIEKEDKDFASNHPDFDQYEKEFNILRKERPMALVEDLYYYAKGKVADTREKDARAQGRKDEKENREIIAESRVPTTQGALKKEGKAAATDADREEAIRRGFTIDEFMDFKTKREARLSKNKK